MTYRLIILVLVMAGCIPLKAQKIFASRGKAEVTVDENISIEQARNQARQLAIINALENEFGTYVEQDASSYIDDDETNFRIIGNTRVRGEWLRTRDEVFHEIQKRVKGGPGRKKELWITCEITGDTRAVTGPAAAIQFFPLNCPSQNCRTYDFADEEPFYLYFKSPVQGFLSIFLAEDDSHVFRLLPYKAMPEEFSNAVPVETDKEYLFFAAGEEYDYFNTGTYSLVDEMVMEADNDGETMYVYIIFSKSEFTKPGLTGNENENSSIPNYLDKRSFENWLLENRIYDPDFLFKKVSITLSGK